MFTEATQLQWKRQPPVSHVVTPVAHSSFDPLNKHNMVLPSEPSTKVNEDGQCAVADTHSFLGRPGAASRTYNLAPRAPVQEQLEIGAYARCFCLRRGWETAPEARTWEA